MVNSKAGWLSWLWLVMLVDGEHHASNNKQQQIKPAKENRLVNVDPKSQNIPLALGNDDASLTALRPPPPILAKNESTMSIFIGLSSFKDGERCGNTIYTAYKRATFPSRLYFGVVDQRSDKDMPCLDAYCALAKQEWDDECRYKDHISINAQNDTDSRGPTYARSLQQQLIQEEDFCLQLDAHSVFTTNWDVGLMNEWKRTENEMAVLSTYIHGAFDIFIEKANGDNKPPGEVPHLCKTIRGGNGLVRNEGASMIYNPSHPQMTALWGAGLSFSKCHAERRVLVDPHTPWLFDGEEFLRSSHLWTYGYDVYSPSQNGSVVYHNYSGVPYNFHSAVKVDKALRKREEQMGRNRFRFHVGMELEGEGLVNKTDHEKYAYGKVRTFEQYLNFSGVSFTPGVNDTDTCYQLHWVPYSDPAEVEELLLGWKMRPETHTAMPKENADEDAHINRCLSIINLIIVIAALFLVKRKFMEKPRATKKL